MLSGGATGMGQDVESFQIEEILQYLSVVIFNKGKRRALLALRDNDAQSMIDYLNALSSHPYFLQLADPKLRKHTLIVLRRLCENSMLYPICYTLDGIDSISLKCAGGFCDIYQGRYQGQNLCLKVVRLYQTGDQNKMLKAHAREAILWNQLKHPNVIPFYGIFYLKELQKRISLLSPWMENGNIVEYLKGNPQLPRRPFLHDIASGLEYLHSQNIVHGDLKGANVLVDEFSTARLADFGLSKIVTDATLGFPDTSDAITGLTTNWASPELLEDHARHTRESDIWAFGCVCYEVLTGLSPFQGCTGIQVVRKLIDRKLPAQPVNDRLDPNVAVNKRIWSLVKQCWSFEVARRPKCGEILQKMKTDAMIWQLRAGGSNCESRLSQYVARIANPVLDHNQARWFLEVIGLQEDGAGMDKEESRIVDDSNSSVDQVSFVNHSFSTSAFLSPPPRFLRSDYSPSFLPNPPLADTRDATGIPRSPSLRPPAIMHLSLSRPSRLSFPENNMDDRREDGTETNGGNSQTADSSRPSGSLINQCFLSIVACLESCLRFLCCLHPHSRRKYSAGHMLQVLTIEERDDFILHPMQATRPVAHIGVVESEAARIVKDYVSAQQSAHLLSPPNPVFSTQSRQSLHLQPPPFQPLSLAYSEGSWNLERQSQPSGQYSPQGRHHNQSIFQGAQDFVIDNSVTISAGTSNPDQFMRKLLSSTIPGAAFDSSARDPPPRCHPGTRLDIIKRCLHFIANCSGVNKIRWVFGAAGVGKSAIMQSVAESPELPVSHHASVFLSVNGRSDGTKVITTLCYQFAVKFDLYRHFIKDKVTRDPSLLQASMSMQFNNLIVEPFIKHPQLNSAGRILIIIDGLDECKIRPAQLQLLHLISDFCITYPSSPIVWLIASRPEQHITSFFSTPTVQPAYEKEEILVDSNNSCEDVKLFLRHELAEIKKGSHLLDPKSEWPKGRDFLALTNASDGLFAYAHTVINYIGNPEVKDPASKLRDVLKVIGNNPMPAVPGGKHPMAPLDALYAQVLSNISLEVLGNTRKLLLALVSEWDWFLYPGESNFIVLCNCLAMTPNDAYAALFPLFAVLRVPERSKAHGERPKFFHKSFIDYISHFFRSGLFRDIQLEARQLKALCAQRILNEAPDGIDFAGMDDGSFFGDLTRGHGTGDKISLTWPIDEVDWNDDETRLSMYKTAIGWVINGIRSGEPAFQSQFYIRLLTTRFKSYDYFPYDELSDLAFDESRRHEFTMDGLLKQVPLEAIDFSHLDEYVRLRFYCPVNAMMNTSDPWNPTCTHKRKGEWEEGKDQDWTTNIPRGCRFCQPRLERQLESWKNQDTNHTIPILFTSTGKCCAEYRFVDQNVDTLSGRVWTYRFWFELSLEERKKYGTTV